MWLCERHFEKNAFVNKTNHRLIKYAVPKYFSQPAVADVHITTEKQDLATAIDSPIIGKYLL